MSSGAVANMRTVLYGSAEAEPFAESVSSVIRISVRSLGTQPRCGTSRA
jgi:hypothetical protein